MSFTTKDIVTQFFKQVPGSSVSWKCLCGKKRQQKGSGYTNLRSHLDAEHKEEVTELIANAKEKEGPSVLLMLASKKARSVHGWIEMVVKGLQPFQFVEQPYFRRHCKLDPIAVNTLMQYMHRLTKHVEEKIEKLLPDKFALVFDGWSAGDTHYVAVFASFPVDNFCGFETVLLTFSPMGEEDTLGAEQHHEFLSFCLELYSKSWLNVVALIGDNCSTNRALARVALVPLVGCASHRFNLAVQDLLNDMESLTAKVHRLMTKLKTLLAAAKLRRLTHLKPREMNVTRWSSCFEMLLRYQRLKEFLPQLEDSTIDQLTPSARENRRIDEVTERLRDLESITKTLQKETTSLVDVRSLFDAAIEEFPEMTERLRADGDLVGHVEFETGIVLLQQGKSGDLTSAQRNSLTKLKADTFTVNDSDSDGDKLSLAERALKRRRTQQNPSICRYVDSRFVLPTSNICERLFSKTGHTLTDRRKSILPSNFEAQVFLHCNAHLWSLSEVNKLV